MLALAVAAVLTAGSLTLFDRGTARVREQRFVQQVATLAQGVRSIFENSGAPPYGPASAVDITARLFALGLGTPESRNGGTFANAYGQAIQITTDGPWFTVTSLVPTEACFSAWQKMPGLHGIRVTGGAIQADLLAPFDAAAQATIQDSCRGGPVSVGYRFR